MSLLLLFNAPSGDAFATLTGSESVAGIGTLIGTGGANTALTGSGSTTATGTMTADGGIIVNGNAALTGNQSAGSTGAIIASGTAAASMTGTQSPISIGVLTGKGGASAALPGGTLASATGNLSANGTATAGLIGASSALLTGDLVADGGGFVISAARAGLIHQLALLHGLDAANPLMVSASARSAGVLTQSVSGSATVTVTTSAAPVFSGDLNAWIDGLAALHGLTVPLVVTDSTRNAGLISQTISTAGGLTTVTRQ